MWPATGGRAPPKIVAGQVYPALDREIAAVTALRANQPPRRRRVAPAATAMKFMPPRWPRRRRRNSPPTKSTRSGLQQVAEISAELDKILRSRRADDRHGRRAADGVQQAPGPALSEHRRRTSAADRRPQRWREGDVRPSFRRPLLPCLTSRSRSAGFRRKSRTERRTAITGRRRSMVRARRSTSSI